MGKQSQQDGIARLLNERESLRVRRLKLQEKHEKILAEIARVRTLETEVDNQIHRSRIGEEMHGGWPERTSLRSLHKMNVWSAIHRVLSQASGEGGVSHRAISDAIYSVNAHVPAGTVRSYLHRFKMLGLIQKRGDYWFLTENGHSSNVAVAQR